MYSCGQEEARAQGREPALFGARVTGGGCGGAFSSRSYKLFREATNFFEKPQIRPHTAATCRHNHVLISCLVTYPTHFPPLLQRSDTHCGASLQAQWRCWVPTPRKGRLQWRRLLVGINPSWATPHWSFRALHTGHRRLACCVCVDVASNGPMM